MKDLYAILGIDRRAPPDEVKRAYRRLAREHHPDRHPGDARAEELFKELGAAYAVLSNPKLRGRYDRGEIDANGAPRPRARPGARAGARTGAGRDPFSRFRREGAARSEGGRDFRIDGADVEYAVQIAFLEAARGAERTIDMTNGKTVKLAIPAGTRDGQILRLKGQGMPGLGGGHDGDALITISVEPDAAFQADGDDVRADAAVTLPEAVLGGRIEVPTIDGPVTVTVPKGSNSGTQLRLRGKGLMRANGGRGDHYVTIKVMLPESLDDEFIEFVRDWGTKHPYRVREN